MLGWIDRSCRRVLTIGWRLAFKLFIVRRVCQMLERHPFGRTRSAPARLGDVAMQAKGRRWLSDSKPAGPESLGPGSYREVPFRISHGNPLIRTMGTMLGGGGNGLGRLDPCLECHPPMTASKRHPLFSPHPNLSLARLEDPPTPVLCFPSAASAGGPQRARLAEGL